jgi:RNA methyltransferase, TrmH family
MVSVSRIKHISSLKTPKFRELYRQTVAEGSKLIREMLLTGYPFLEAFATPEWVDAQPQLARNLGNRLTVCSAKDLERMSAQKSPQGVLAVLDIPDNQSPLGNCAATLYCDRISDPGNMGTILRIADWFGIGQVVTSPGSVALFSPKVIQASMGSIFRMHHTQATLETLLEAYSGKPHVYGAVMNGTPLQEVLPTQNPHVIVIGNESEGISPETLQHCTHTVTIPGKDAGSVHGESAESLNAAIAAALLCYHFTGHHRNPIE